MIAAVSSSGKGGLDPENRRLASSRELIQLDLDPRREAEARERRESFEQITLASHPRYTHTRATPFARANAV